MRGTREMRNRKVQRFKGTGLLNTDLYSLYSSRPVCHLHRGMCTVTETYNYSVRLKKKKRANNSYSERLPTLELN